MLGEDVTRLSADLSQVRGEMRAFIWTIGRNHWLRGLADRACWDQIPLRTLFNSRTQEYEEIRLTEFQQLLLQGRIQETVKRPPDGLPQRVYLLI
jgi:hypothetical protein